MNPIQGNTTITRLMQFVFVAMLAFAGLTTTGCGLVDSNGPDEIESVITSNPGENERVIPSQPDEGLGELPPDWPLGVGDNPPHIYLPSDK